MSVNLANAYESSSEISPNNRAVCKDTVCKKNAVKVAKGTIRFGSWIEMPDGHGSWGWKHWGCVSGEQVVNLQMQIESGDGYDWNGIDGYDEIECISCSLERQMFMTVFSKRLTLWHRDNAVKEKIRRVVTQGFIDDEDFLGDPGFNKPGQKGIRVRKTKKQLEAEKAVAAKDEADQAAKEPSPVETKAGKRKSAVADQNEDDAAPAPTKPKIKRGKAVKAGQNSDDAVSAAPEKRKRGKTTALDAEDEPEENDAVNKAEQNGDESALSAAAKYKQTKGKAAAPHVQNGEAALVTAPTKKGHGKSKLATAAAKDKSAAKTEAREDVALAAVKGQKKADDKRETAAKKAKAKKRAEAEKPVQEEHEPEPEPAPAARRNGKGKPAAKGNKRNGVDEAEASAPKRSKKAAARLNH